MKKPGQCGNLKIVFIGTPEFSSIVLEKLILEGCKPELVVTAPDKPVGRQQTVTSPAVKIAAEKHGIHTIQPDRIKTIADEIKSINPDLIILAAYGQIIPREILDAPKYGALNVHPSLLPKYRGASPIQTAILNGDKETGVTIMKMNEKVDEGEILNISKTLIDKNDTYSSLSLKLADTGANLLIGTISPWIEGRITPIVQNEIDASFTRVLKKEDGKIKWSNPAESIERQIRAFNPWPGSFCEWQNEKGELRRIKILKAKTLEQTDSSPFGEPGKTYLAIDDQIAVQTGKDFLIIQELQLEGKKAMPSKEFIIGYLNFFGTILK